MSQTTESLSPATDEELSKMISNGIKPTSPEAVAWLRGARGQPYSESDPKGTSRNFDAMTDAELTSRLAYQMGYQSRTGDIGVIGH